MSGEPCDLSLTGKELDFTTGPIGRAIVLLAIPMVLEMVMESVFALTDAFFVSRLGTDAVATVGLTEAMITILWAVAGGTGIATTAMVARRIGEKDIPGARVAAAQAILLGLGLTAFIAVPGVLWARDLLAFMGGSPELIASGHGYTRVLFGGCATITLLFLLNAVFRGAGDAAIAMRVLWIANAINIVLDPCLIFGLGPFPELGVTGAAVATTIGRGIGVLLQLWVLFFGGSRIRIDLTDLIPRLGIILRLFRLSIGGILQTLIGTSSWIFLVWIVGQFGAAAVAGYTIAIRLIIFAILPSWGLANAAATLVGQNLGAGEPERAETSAWRAGIYNTIFLLGVAVVFVAAAESHDPAFHQRSRRDRVRRLLPPLGLLRLPLLRLGNGHGPELQRCRRHLHPDGDQLLLLLALSAPPRLLPRPRRRLRRHRRLHGHRHRRGRYRGRRDPGLSPGRVEAPNGLTYEL